MAKILSFRLLKDGGEVTHMSPLSATTHPVNFFLHHLSQKVSPLNALLGEPRHKCALAICLAKVFRHRHFSHLLHCSAFTQ